MKIRISDKNLRNRELSLEVSGFCTDGVTMVFSLDSERYFTDFVVSAIKNGLVKSAVRNVEANTWVISMPAECLIGMFNE